MEIVSTIAYWPFHFNLFKMIFEWTWTSCVIIFSYYATLIKVKKQWPCENVKPLRGISAVFAFPFFEVDKISSSWNEIDLASSPK